MPPVAQIAEDILGGVAPIAEEIGRHVLREVPHIAAHAAHEQSGGEGPGGDECEDCCGLLECCCVIM